MALPMCFGYTLPKGAQAQRPERPRGKQMIGSTLFSRARIIFSVSVGIVVLAGLSPSACSRVRLEFPEQEVDTGTVDNLLEISGNFCVSPSTNVIYPVKVTFIVDGSGSQQFADQNRQRVTAVVDTITTLVGSGNVFFKLIVFNSSITATPVVGGTSEFTNDLGVLNNATNNLAEADTLTDYQGALAYAYNGIVNDIITVSATEGASALSRTKYVNILISDGIPDPQCTAGLCNDTSPVFPADPACGGIRTDLLCENQNYIKCMMKAQNAPCSEGLCNTECGGGVCSFDETTCYDQGDSAPTLFGGAEQTQLSGGADYNQPYQILKIVNDIMQLQKDYEVGEIRVHAGLVLDPLVDPAVIAVFGDPAQAIPLMKQVAEVGQGQYLEFYGGDSINFVGVNFRSIKQPRVIRTFWADNVTTKIRANGLVPDSDADGLPDQEEFDLKSSPINPDTDCDGYGDLIEYQLRGFGFDFADPCMPAPPGATACITPLDPCDPGANLPSNCQPPPPGVLCTPIHGIDSDLDGLTDCEEIALKTDCNNADTDADGIDDRTEIFASLNPLIWDFDIDSDQDGEPNGREIKWHLNPVLEQNSAQIRNRYRYDRNQITATVDSRSCFEFDIRKIELMSTADATNIVGDVGENIVRVYMGENLADTLTAPPLYRTACIRARFVPPNIKRPLGGKIELYEEDFGYILGPDPYLKTGIIDTFDITTDCLDSCSDFSACAGCQSCATGVCRDVGWECCDDSACGGGASCVSHTCKQPCAEASPCSGTNEVCYAGACWQSCGTDEDCSGSATCQPDGLCWIIPQN